MAHAVIWLINDFGFWYNSPTPTLSLGDYLNVVNAHQPVNPILVDHGWSGGATGNWNIAATACAVVTTTLSSSSAVTVSTDNGGFAGNLTALNLATATAWCGGTPPPTGYTFPYGFFDFKITGLMPSSSANVTLAPSHESWWQARGQELIIIGMLILISSVVHMYANLRMKLI